MEDILKFLNIPGMSKETNNWLNYFDKSLTSPFRTSQFGHSKASSAPFSTVTSNLVKPKDPTKDGFLSKLNTFTKSETGKYIGKTVTSALSIADSLAKPLDNTTKINSALDITSNLASSIPGYGWIASGVLKGINIADKLTAKNSIAQDTANEVISGYNLDINANAGTSYGGIFGNKARKKSDSLTKLYDNNNIKKISASYQGNQDILSAKNNVQDIYQKNMQKIVGGPSLKLLSAKKGAKIQRSNLKNISKKASGNVIPDGALHARKHNLPEEIKENVTNKGIPIISYDEKGGITQHVEIEINEIIFSKETTAKLEELHKKYKDVSDKEKNDIAIEAGKFLTFEILENTTDNTGLLNEV